MKPKNYVLMLPKWFPNPENTREGNYVADQINAIGKEINVIVVFVHSSNKYKGNVKVSIEQVNDGMIYRLFFPRFNGSNVLVNKLVNAYRYYKSLNGVFKDIINKHGYPVFIHTHVLHRTLLYAIYSKWRYKLAVYHSEHWSLFLPERIRSISFFKKWAMKAILNQPHAISCVSNALKSGLESINSGKNIDVIFNAVNTEVFLPGDYSAKSGTVFKFIHVSRLDDYPKNLPGILRSIGKLTEDLVHVELHIAGDGVMFKKQEKLALNLDLLDKKVFFHGYLNSEELAKLFAQCHCLVVFSYYESQSKVILEAFSCGVPVIATKVGGIPEIVNPKRGMLVEAGNEEALLTAMMEMAGGKARDYDHKKLREYAIQNASFKFVGSQFISSYQKAGLLN